MEKPDSAIDDWARTCVGDDKRGTERRVDPVDVNSTLTIAAGA